MVSFHDFLPLLMDRKEYIVFCCFIVKLNVNSAGIVTESLPKMRGSFFEVQKE